MCYISLSRKITYLNSCEDSDLFATRLEMVQILRRQVVEAQEQGELCQDADPDEITELVMGLYLISQFQWVHQEQHTPAYWSHRLEQAFRRVMAGFLAQPLPREN